MVNRKRNLKLGLWLTKEEKQLIKSLADIKGMIITNLIIELVRREKEKLEQKNK